MLPRCCSWSQRDDQEGLSTLTFCHEPSWIHTCCPLASIPRDMPMCEPCMLRPKSKMVPSAEHAERSLLRSKGTLAHSLEGWRPSSVPLPSPSTWRDAERALALFRQMEGGSIERSTVTYTGLIHACAEGGQLDKAMALFTYMDVAGVERNPVTYCVAINGCTRNGQWELGLQLLHEMARKGVR